MKILAVELTRVKMRQAIYTIDDQTRVQVLASSNVRRPTPRNWASERRKLDRRLLLDDPLK